MKQIIKQMLAVVTLMSISAGAIAGVWDDVDVALDKKDYRLAVLILKPLADKGDPQAQAFVGTMLFTGKVVKKEAKTGVRFLEMCANNPNTSEKEKGGCMWLLSTAYVGGEDGIAEDMNLALNYMWRAAKYGNKNAINQLTESVCKNRGSDCPAVLKERIAQCSEPCLQ